MTFLGNHSQNDDVPVFWVWVLLAIVAVVVCGCAAPTRGFTRASWEHYGTRTDTYYSAASAQVGRYFTLVEDKCDAELSVGTWYGIREDRTYGLVGGAITWLTDAQVYFGVNLELLVPEDGRGLDEVELSGGVSVEVPLP